MQEVKELMLQAIMEQRPLQIQNKCLPIWNQPFFYKIDKAKVITVSYNPTDKGARTNYYDFLQKYIQNPNSVSAQEIYDLLYNFKKETYWRKSYDLMFKQVGLMGDEIAHVDVSFFPYKTFDDFLCLRGLDKTYIYMLKLLELLKHQLKIIFIDGAKNKDIIDDYFIKDFLLINQSELPINKSKPKKLLIYKHKSLNLYLIYYACFMYGSTCPSDEKIIEIGKYIKQQIKI